MKVLHLLKSEPDETVEKMTEMFSQKNESSVIALYGEKVDWLTLVDHIFSYDKVICWW